MNLAVTQNFNHKRLTGSKKLTMMFNVINDRFLKDIDNTKSVRRSKSISLTSESYSSDEILKTFKSNGLSSK